MPQATSQVHSSRHPPVLHSNARQTGCTRKAASAFVERAAFSVSRIHVQTETLPLLMLMFLYVCLCLSASGLESETEEHTSELWILSPACGRIRVQTEAVPSLVPMFLHVCQWCLASGSAGRKRRTRLSCEFCGRRVPPAARERCQTSHYLQCVVLEASWLLLMLLHSYFTVTSQLLHSYFMVNLSQGYDS